MLGFVRLTEGRKRRLQESLVAEMNRLTFLTDRADRQRTLGHDVLLVDTPFSMKRGLDNMTGIYKKLGENQDEIGRLRLRSWSYDVEARLVNEFAEKRFGGYKE